MTAGREATVECSHMAPCTPDYRCSMHRAGREATCLCRGHVHNVLPGGDDCFQCHCTTLPGREASPCRCGHDRERHARGPCDDCACAWFGPVSPPARETTTTSEETP